MLKWSLNSGCLSFLSRCVSLRKCDIADNFEPLPIHFEFQSSPVGSSNGSIKIIDHINWLPVDLKQDVADFHFSLPAWRLRVDQKNHHSLRVHHRAHAQSKVHSFAINLARFAKCQSRRFKEVRHLHEQGSVCELVVDLAAMVLI